MIAACSKTLQKVKEIAREACSAQPGGEHVRDVLCVYANGLMKYLLQLLLLHGLDRT
jgi:hypothetical protein